MHRAATRTGRLSPAAIAALLALVLSLRVVGAALLGPGVAGFVPICTGTEIAWVAVDAEGQALPETAPKSETCAFFGLALAAPAEPPPAIPRPAPRHAAPERPAVAAPPRSAPAAFHPRGPPSHA